MEGVTDIIRFTPDIDFDDVWGSVDYLLLVSHALRRMHRICSSIDDFGGMPQDANLGWYRVGALTRSKGSYFKWDFESWFPEEILR